MHFALFAVEHKQMTDETGQAFGQKFQMVLTLGKS